MDSSPPATDSCTSPARIWSAAIITAFMPEPHILLIVVVGTPWGMPAASAAWRAGACPRPAGSTQPMITSWTSAAERFAAASAPLMAAAPSCGAVAGASTPWNAPMGVRVAAAITTCLSIYFSSLAATEAAIEHINKSVRDLRRLQRGVLAVPVAHPVECAGQCEGGHPGVAGADGAVRDSGVDERAHAPVDAGLQ